MKKFQTFLRKIVWYFSARKYKGKTSNKNYHHELLVINFSICSLHKDPAREFIGLIMRACEGFVRPTNVALLWKPNWWISGWVLYVQWNPYIEWMEASQSDIYDPSFQAPFSSYMWMTALWSILILALSQFSKFMGFWAPRSWFNLNSLSAGGPQLQITNLPLSLSLSLSLSIYIYI